MDTPATAYPARLSIDYPEALDRLTTFFRLLWAIPIIVILALLSGGWGDAWANDTARDAASTGGGLANGMVIATALMLVFRRRYPRWWFDFGLELTRFGTRVGAYLALLTDRYPSTVEEQAVHLDVDYPDAERLDRWLPLVKWLLAIPHYIVLFFLILAALVVVLIAWVAILITGRYPRGLFDFVVGVFRWGTRVSAYAFLLVTDKYPPFSLR